MKCKPISSFSQSCHIFYENFNVPHAIFIWLHIVYLNYEHIKWVPLCPNGIFNMNKDENVWGYSLGNEAVL